jgi:hypothetical protein
LPVLLVLGWTAVATAHAAAPEYVQEILAAAKAKATDVDGQVKVLLRLSWPTEGSPDPLVQAAARNSMVRYGHHALPVIRRAIPGLDPLYQADATAALIEARFKKPAGMPPDFLPGLEEAIWYGSIEAQRIGLNEIKRYQFPPAVLSSIDAAYANPELTRYVLRSLGSMGDVRAQFFMSEVLLSGADRYKETAAFALRDLGGSPINALRRAAGSDEASVRQAALAALLPLTGVDDLSLLHDFHALRTDDDPALRQAVRERAIVLEQELEKEQAAESASPGQD